MEMTVATDVLDDIGTCMMRVVITVVVLFCTYRTHSGGRKKKASFLEDATADFSTKSQKRSGPKTAATYSSGNSNVGFSFFRYFSRKVGDLFRKKSSNSDEESPVDRDISYSILSVYFTEVYCWGPTVDEKNEGSISHVLRIFLR